VIRSPAKRIRRKHFFQPSPHGMIVRSLGRQLELLSIRCQSVLSE
jgi:hypothetical protein